MPWPITQTAASPFPHACMAHYTNSRQAVWSCMPWLITQTAASPCRHRASRTLVAGGGRGTLLPTALARVVCPRPVPTAFPNHAVLVPTRRARTPPGNHRRTCISMYPPGKTTIHQMWIYFFFTESGCETCFAWGTVDPRRQRCWDPMKTAKPHPESKCCLQAILVYTLCARLVCQTGVGLKGVYTLCARLVWG